MTSTRRFLIHQALVLAGAMLATGLLAPGLLMLDDDVVGHVLASGALAAAIALALVSAITALHLRGHRYLLRALAMGSHGLETEDLGGLAELASALATRFFVVTSAVFGAWALPGLRPAGLDTGRALSLGLLCVTILAAAAIPFYVLVRRTTMRLVESAPLASVTQLLEHEHLARDAEPRVRRKVLLAIAAPVALVGIGAVLVTRAHARNLIEDSERETATMLARAALEPSPGLLPEAGREEAAGAVRELGFEARVRKRAAEPGPEVTPETGHEPAAALEFRRDPDGSIIARVPLRDGVADVGFSPALPPGSALSGAVLALVAVLGAALLGSLLGRALGNDLVLATRKLRGLGTETVLRGDADLAKAARFDAVRALGHAVEGVANRFRVFAAAQERAIEARGAALRMRGLLFASVSHDLKSPLNAILGFAELVGREDLAPEQRESLDLITSRGRELLALIETILDAARVEAGQLTLAPRLVQVRELVREAVAKARELAAGAALPIEVQQFGDLPGVPIDPGYGTRALAVVLAHALRLAAETPGTKSLRVRATVPGSPGSLPLFASTKPRAWPHAHAPVLVDVTLPKGGATAAELEALFARQVTTRGRGLTLGLSLARSVLELHGGLLEVATEDDATVVRFWLALAMPERRPRLSSIPALSA